MQIFKLVTQIDTHLFVFVVVFFLNFFFILTGQGRCKDNNHILEKRRESSTLQKHSHNERIFCLFDTMDNLQGILNSDYVSHLFVFVCPLTRYSNSRKNFLKSVVSAFDASFFRRSILIFTHESKEQKMKIEEEIQKVRRIDENIGKLILTNGYMICHKECLTKDSESRRKFRNEFANKLINAVFNSIVFLPSGKKSSSQNCSPM